MRVVPSARDREVVPREPAPKRDVPGAEDVAVELDSNEGIRARVTRRARSGRRIREVRRGVGSVAEGAALERAPRRGLREERRDARVRVHARAVDVTGDGRGDAFAARRRLPRDRRQLAPAAALAEEQVVRGAKRVDARGASLGEVDRVHADDDGAREEVAEPRPLVVAAVPFAVEHRGDEISVKVAPVPGVRDVSHVARYLGGKGGEGVAKESVRGGGVETRRLTDVVDDRVVDERVEKVVEAVAAGGRAAVEHGAISQLMRALLAAPVAPAVHHEAVHDVLAADDADRVAALRACTVRDAGVRRVV
mmetsp:Transcript_5237/g.21359  ORF Transcript_5237/g.21359 Transcript_5237/m.21359 type:complete len:308 (+) Transcript_5237:1632-2555(+)